MTALNSDNICNRNSAWLSAECGPLDIWEGGGGNYPKKIRS